jgi:hypothetical protein
VGIIIQAINDLVTMILSLTGRKSENQSLMLVLEDYGIKGGNILQTIFDFSIQNELHQRSLLFQG